jgi:CBS domain-containing protein
MTQVRDVMTSNPTTCSMEASVADAATVMAQEDVGPIPIMEGDRLVGILTDRDIVVRVVAEGRDPQSTTVGEVASTDLATVAPDENLDRACSFWPSSRFDGCPSSRARRSSELLRRPILRQGDDRTTGQVVEQISED